MPKGETGMHGHKEIDVISVMVDGEVIHEGSLEHGKGLVAGSVQVQRAGAEGFQHNEVNPKNKENHMIQLWVLPDKKGESAGYKMYQPEDGKLTHIYGGKQHQDKTFYSRTQIHDVGNGKSDQVFSRKGPVMAYLSKGHGDINGSEITARTLISSKSTLTFTAKSDSQIIFITEQ